MGSNGTGVFDRPATIAGGMFHRQMYVDLVRAYLPAYGSRRDLARALDVDEAYVQRLLAPPRARTRAGRFVAVKTPRAGRAEQIAALLCADEARRNALLRHLEGARARLAAPGPRG